MCCHNSCACRTLRGRVETSFVISWLAGWLCAAAAILLPASPSIAADTTPLKLVESKATSLESDGVRYAAWNTSQARIVRLDMRDRRQRISVVPTCRPEDAAWSQLLLSCTDRPPARRPIVLSLRAGTAQAVPTPNGLADHYFQIGRYWLEGNSCGSGCMRTWVNWRTGEYREIGAAGNFADLDSPQLGPVNRESTAIVVFGGKGDDSLILSRGKKETVLSRCPRDCYSFKVRVRGGRVVWAEGTTVRAYDVATGKRARWTFSVSGQVTSRFPLTVRHTTRGVLVAVPRSNRPEATARVYEARWP